MKISSRRGERLSFEEFSSIINQIIKKSSYHLITKNLKEYVQKIVEIEETLNKQ